MLQHLLPLICVAAGFAPASSASFQQEEPAPLESGKTLSRLEQMLVKRKANRVRHLELRRELQMTQSHAKKVAAEIKQALVHELAAFDARVAGLKASVSEAAQAVTLTNRVVEANEETVEALKAQGVRPENIRWREAQRDLVQAKRASAKAELTHSALREANLGALDELQGMTAKERQAERSKWASEQTKELRSEQSVLDREVTALQWQIEALDMQLELSDKRWELEQDARERDDDAQPAPEAKRTLIEDDYVHARALAAAAAKPLLLNFTAHTAINARQMEVQVFTTKAVAPLLDDFVEARLHGDAQDPAAGKDIARRAKEIAKTTAQPIYVVIDPRSGEELGRFEGGDPKGERFTAFLKASSKRFNHSAPPASDVELWERIIRLEDQVRQLKAD